jgi:hypothetical protein
MHMAETWGRRRDLPGPTQRSGFVAYAEEQIALWNELGRVAELMFLRINSHHILLWKPVEHRPNMATAAP